MKVKSLEKECYPPPHLLQEWNAFTALSRRRPVGMAIGAIPIADIRGWLDELGITDPDEREDFIIVIEALDHEFMRVQNEKAKAKK